MIDRLAISPSNSRGRESEDVNVIGTGVGWYGRYCWLLLQILVREECDMVTVMTKGALLSFPALNIDGETNVVRDARGLDDTKTRSREDTTMYYKRDNENCSQKTKRGEVQ